MDDSFRLAARVLLYVPSHRQDNTYHGLCYTTRGALRERERERDKEREREREGGGGGGGGRTVYVPKSTDGSGIGFFALYVETFSSFFFWRVALTTF